MSNLKLVPFFIVFRPGLHTKDVQSGKFFFAFPPHQILTATINYDRFLIYEFSLRENCLWQSKCGRGEAKEKHTKCVEVNSYVLETSGVLMFFVFVLRTQCSNIELGKMIYEHSEHKMRWEGKKFRFSVSFFATFDSASFHAIKKFAHLKNKMVKKRALKHAPTLAYPLLIHTRRRLIGCKSIDKNTENCQMLNC